MPHKRDCPGAKHLDILQRNARSISGRLCCAHHVWPEGPSNLGKREKWPSAAFQRIHRQLRAAGGDLGMFASTKICSPLCRRCIHHRGILVYGFDFICQSGSNGCPVIHQYFRRYSPRGCTGLHCNAVCGRPGSNAVVQVAGSHRCLREQASCWPQTPIPNRQAMRPI